MSTALRPLARPLAAASIVAAVLIAWIRTQPLEMPRLLQLLLSVGLLTAVVILLLLVRRTEPAAIEPPGAQVLSEFDETAALRHSI